MGAVMKELTSSPGRAGLDVVQGGHQGDLLEPLSIEETLDRLVTLAVKKWEYPLSYLFQSLAGGGMVAFGVILAIAVSTGIQTPGVANLVSGLVFGFSFVVILMSNSTLITSDMAAGFIALVRGRMAFGSYLGFMAVGWIGNVIGALIFVGIIAIGPGPYATLPFLQRAHMLGFSKAGADSISMFTLGIICTWFLQTALFLYFKARTDVGRMILAYYGPLAFVAGMTEHCIANAGFIALPLFMQGRLAAALGGTLPATGPMQALTWGLGPTGFLRNELLAGAGNLVGGTVFMALVFLAIVRFRRPR
ncbi:MAG: formate/nitrite transporter family protein [Betaproteobacteria bacterium]|nr:formate/nitrite transporter family protein [Betaproteobacteria bacterium]